MNIFRPSFLCLAISILLCAGASAENLSDSETQTLIRRIADSRRGKTMQAEFRDEKHLPMLKKPVVESGTLAFRPPNQFRREVTENQGSLTVCDGKVLWIYYPAFQEAEKYTLDSHRALRESLSALTAGLSLENVEKNFAIRAQKGASGYSLELTPRTSSLRKVVSAIRLEVTPSLEASRMEIVSPSGDRTLTTFRNEKAVQLPPSAFQFAPPAGVSVTEPLK